MITFIKLQSFPSGCRVLENNACGNTQSKVIVIRNKTVYLYTEGGSSLFKEYACDFQPIEAVLFQFPGLDSAKVTDDFLAILIRPNLLRVHALTSGEAFDVLIPFSATGIFPCSVGLLLCRRYASQSFADVQVDDDNLPMYFTLSQVLMPLRPICYCNDNYSRRSGASPMDVDEIFTKQTSSYSFHHSNVSSEHNEIVAVFDSYVCLKNNKTNSISLWSLEHIKSSNSLGEINPSTSLLDSTTSFSFDHSDSVSGIISDLSIRKKASAGDSDRKSRNNHTSRHKVEQSNLSLVQLLGAAGHSPALTAGWTGASESPAGSAEPDVCMHSLDSDVLLTHRQCSITFSKSLQGSLQLNILYPTLGVLEVYVLREAQHEPVEQSFISCATSDVHRPSPGPAAFQAHLELQARIMCAAAGSGSPAALASFQIPLGDPCSEPGTCPGVAVTVVATEGHGIQLYLGAVLLFQVSPCCAVSMIGSAESTLDLVRVQSLVRGSRCFLAVAQDGSQHILSAAPVFLGVLGVVAEALVCVLPEQVASMALQVLLIASREVDLLYLASLLLLSAFGLHRIPNLFNTLIGQPISSNVIENKWMEVSDSFTIACQTFRDKPTCTFATLVFDTFHAILEDRRLYGHGLMKGEREMVSAVLVVAHSAGTQGRCVIDHYWRRGLTLPTSVIAILNQQAVYSFVQFTYFSSFVPSVPCSINWLTDCLCSLAQYDYIELDTAPTPSFQPFWLPKLASSPYLSKRLCAPLSCIRLTVSFLEALSNEISQGITMSMKDSGERWEHWLIGALRSCELREQSRFRSSTDVRRRLPLALRLLCECALQLHQDNVTVKDGWTSDILSLLSREDVLAASKMSPNSDFSNTQGRALLQGKALASKAAADSFASLGSNSDESADGLREVYILSQRRFAEDERVKEVCRLLRSSRPLYLRIPYSGGDLDASEALRHKQQIKLLSLCRRSLACSVGRGLFTLSSLDPLLAEPLPIPPLSLEGRVPPTSAVVALDTSSAPTDLTLWPEFHNGVAAGLRVRASTRRVTRNWILYNRPPQPNTAHAGVLLALGLLGHLKALSVTDVCDYLTTGHEPTAVAILIGLPASNIGTSDPLLSKTLCLHLPSLLPLHHLDLEVSPLVQVAALAGLGLLYCGSAHRLIVEFLLSELGRKTTSDRVDYKEALSLTCGWALGMVLLGQGGGGAVGLSDLIIEERLQSFISGGNRKWLSQVFGVDLPVNPMDSNAKSSRVLDGDEINADVTGPGAILALSLMYIKSNNESISKRMSLPSTAFELDSIRPDMLLFRCLGICLVMWGSVSPTAEWMDSMIPELLRTSLFPSSDENSHSFHSRQRLEKQVALCAYMCAMAGTCLGLGLVFAGTADTSVRDILMSKVKFLQSLRENKHASLSVDRSGRSLLEMCLCTTALGLCVAMAGSGDFLCQRVVRELRWKVEDTQFGTHMANAMCLGGQASLKRDPVSIAALVLALCPRYPGRSADHQYHLQALRHLCVLAVEGRALQPLDAVSGGPVNVQVEVELKDGSKVVRSAPCLLPELATVRVVRCLSPEYFPSELDVEGHVNAHNQRTQSSSRASCEGCVQTLPPLLVRSRPKPAPAPSIFLNPFPNNIGGDYHSLVRELCMRMNPLTRGGAAKASASAAMGVTSAPLVNESGLMHCSDTIPIGISSASAMALQLAVGSTILTSNTHQNIRAQSDGFPSYGHAERSIGDWEEGTEDILCLFKLLRRYRGLSRLLVDVNCSSPSPSDSLLTLSASLSLLSELGNETFDDLAAYAVSGVIPEAGMRQRCLSVILVVHRLPYFEHWPSGTAQVLAGLKSQRSHTVDSACNMLRVHLDLKDTV